MPILLILLLVSSIAGGGWFYYTDTQTRLAQLRDNNAQLKISAEENERTIEAMVTQAEQNQRLADELQEKLNKSEEGRNRLITLFGKHDLTRLAMKKPGLIETRVNNGTKKAFDGIESISSTSTDDGVQPPQ
jgi:predicted ribosome quality control (RQC) complex YloA/Tae2 family protein